MSFFRMMVATACLGMLAAEGAWAQPFNVLSKAEEAQGFKSLFDGTLSHLNENFVNYRQNDSTNVVLALEWKLEPSLGAVVTDNTFKSEMRSVRKYKDFDMRFDYRNSGDGGFFYRFALREATAWGSGLEYAILNDADNCIECAGSALGLYNPVPKVYLAYSTGEWNQARVVAIGDSVEHWLNGVKVVGYRTHSADFWTRFDKSKWAGSSVTYKVPGNRFGGYLDEGYVGFQSTDKGAWQLRNIRINSDVPKLGQDRWWPAPAPSTHAGKARTAPKIAAEGHAPALAGGRMLIGSAPWGFRSLDGRLAEPAE